MRLISLSVENLRCHRSLQSVPFHSLTVFVGENDAGKSSLVRALCLLLRDEAPTPGDFALWDDGQAQHIQLTAVFEVGSDPVPQELTHDDGSRLTLRKTFTAGAGRVCEVYGRVYEDERVQGWLKLSAPDQKALLQEFGLAPATNKEARTQQLDAYLAGCGQPTCEAFKEVPFSSLTPYLPALDIVASQDYQNPSSVAQASLQNELRRYLLQLHDRGDPLLEDLQRIEHTVSEHAQTFMQSMLPFVQKTMPGVVNLEAMPNMDFARGLSVAGLRLDDGRGLRDIGTFGEGTKKKLWMSLLEWSTSRGGHDAQRVIRVFDEPDVNLDYAAEKRLFQAISTQAKQADAPVQTVVCTHSVTLVDQAPTECINLIRVGAAGERSVEFLRTGESEPDSRIRAFFTDVANNLGVSNTALFYERAFLVVEGETEEAAIPCLYQRLFHRSLLQDGIVLVNLQGCGAWKTTLTFLGRHRQPLTVMVLDTDCTAVNASARITREVLEQLGYPATHMEEQCFFLGQKEFEDAFSDDVILRALNQTFPKETGDPWRATDLAPLREAGHRGTGKFSEDFQKLVKRTCLPAKRNEVRKPQLGQALAGACDDQAAVPAELLRAFVKLRSLCGLDA